MTRLLTTAEVADRLAVSEEFVRDHAGELEAIRLGRGSRSPLRFEPTAIDGYLERQRIAAPITAPRRRPGPRRGSRRSHEILPLPQPTR